MKKLFIAIRGVIFLVPFGKAWSSFLSELTRLYQAFVEDSVLCSIAMMACFVMQPLLLQKPSQRSRTREHFHHINIRIDLWKKGSFDELMNECRCIQNHLKSTHPGSDQSQDVACF